MCGRYAIVPRKSSWAPIEDVLGPDLLEALRAMEARYNVAPSQAVPIIYKDRESGAVRCELARWGLIPHWWHDAKLPTHTINARSEDASRKPMWRHAWQHARCLIPATHWYEWQVADKGKIPHALTHNHGEGFIFAGLYSNWRRPDGQTILSCAILTQNAAPSIANIHDRMPIVLSPRLWEQWIDPGMTAPRTIVETLGVNRELGDMGIEAYPISTKVNSPRNQGPDILLPDDEP